MSALGVLIITIMAAGYGLWMRHSCVKEIKEIKERRRRRSKT